MYPVIGNLSVKDVDIGLVLKILEPIWSEKSETASRVRGRIVSVLNMASATIKRALTDLEEKGLIEMVKLDHTCCEEKLEIMGLQHESVIRDCSRYERE